MANDCLYPFAPGRRVEACGSKSAVSVSVPIERRNSQSVENERPNTEVQWLERVFGP
jgi:hypothetical protein